MGQIDAVVMLPLLAAVVLLDRADGRWSWLCWATALLIKPQAIILAPLLYAATLRRHGSRGLARGGALAAGLLAIGVAPLVLAGQAPGLMQAYLGSVGRFPDITSRAYNLWYLVTWGAGGPDTDLVLGPLSFRALGLVLMGSVTLLVFVALLTRSDEPARTEGAAVLMLAFFLLPTSDPRAVSLPLARVPDPLRGSNDRMVVPYLILVATATLNIFGALRGFLPAVHAVLDASPLPQAIALINLMVFLCLLGHLLRLSMQRPLSIPALVIDANSI